MQLKHFLKTSRKSTPENINASVFRSRSIDSMSGNEQLSDAHSGGESAYPDEKPPPSATLAKTFQTLKKRFSRNPNKQESIRQRSNVSDSVGKIGGDDSEGSSAGEEVPPLSFAPMPSSIPDLTDTSGSKPAALTCIRSLPLDKPPEIITSPPPFESLQEKEDSNLSKTWTSGAFTGAQLRGTCSVEYTEHMKDKSHKRKAHMIDLRKDELSPSQQQQQQQQTPNPLTPTSKHSISSTNTSYRHYNFTQLNIPGALF